MQSGAGSGGAFNTDLLPDPDASPEDDLGSMLARCP
jgi:hypothetical protein